MPLPARLLFPGALCLGLLACATLGRLVATPTPVPTATLTSTATAIPTAAASVTPTPPPSGVGIEEQRDGSTLITDYDNLYQFSLGEDWEVIPSSTEQVTDALHWRINLEGGLSPPTESPEPTSNDVRIFAVNTDRRFYDPQYTSNVQVIIDDSRLGGRLPLDMILAGVEDGLKAEHAQLVGSVEESAENKHGVEIAKVEFTQAYPIEKGKDLLVQARVAIFQSNDRLIMVTLWTLPRFAKNLCPELDEVTETIRLLTP